MKYIVNIITLIMHAYQSCMHLHMPQRCRLAVCCCTSGYNGCSVDFMVIQIDVLWANCISSLLQ